MCNISKRLLDERLRLDKNQAEMAEIGGVAKRTYCNYESGEREPMASFFAGLAAAGADVQYILTGIRSVNLPSNPYPSLQSEPAMAAQDSAGYTVTLRPDQAALLDNVEHCAKEDQEAIKRMAFIAAKADNKDETQQGKKKRA
ncbi:MAG TPA: helix-turn-helix transcriptional regulator [Methylobacter sp.]|jgi:transcriptional regulator with XRE-family HTH domain